MSRPIAKGWCPGAYTPMMSGDGLVVRVRPMLARLTRAQILGLCAIAQTHGSGLIDLTSRANLQIRGVAEPDHQTVLAQLAALDLLPDDPALESRRNILIPPLWQHDDVSAVLAAELVTRLHELPALPPKMGHAIDTCHAPYLTQNSADFRLERTSDGALILRADGMSRGRLVTQDTAIDALIEMAHWFVDTGGTDNKRMAKHVTQTPPPAAWQAALPAASAKPARPGTCRLGTFFGVAFGQIEATHLHQLIDASGATALRVTPWRLFLLEGVQETPTANFITDANDPLLHIDACPGAPLCTTATVETRKLARQLSAQLRGPLHVSGCAKGCARPRACATTLVGRDGAFDLVSRGAPWDEPTQTGLAPNQLADILGGL